MAERAVSHKGYVDSINGNRLVVRILAFAACVGCAGESSCATNEMAEKLIDAVTTEKLSPGDPVIVSMSPKLGTIAVLYLFILPSIIVVATIVGISLAFHNDIIAGLASLASLGGWYGILYLFRAHISRDFVFKATLNRSQE